MHSLFTTRIRAAGTLTAFWYSFDYGMTNYLMLDTETDFGNGIIIDFIERDLAAVDRWVTPWVVAAGHRPYFPSLFCSSVFANVMLMRRSGKWYGDSGGCTTCQEAFELLLIKHGVDVTYFGQVHNIQRLGPLANNTKEPRGYNNSVCVRVSG
ncbi:hypothetical protein K438DRAFT_1997875 [Mycena galopus ATCC 62051]|nr:hypothetical protein K438DRAFT_1997875 [Mycena galopus ATCC 62051]